MKIKNQRILKNWAIAGYVYYSKDKKWKWRIFGKNNKKGGEKYSLTLINEFNNTEKFTVDDLLNPNLDEIVEEYFIKSVPNENLNIIIRDYPDIMISRETSDFLKEIILYIGEQVQWYIGIQIQIIR